MNKWKIESPGRIATISLALLLAVVFTSNAEEIVDQQESTENASSVMFDLDFPGGSLSDLTSLISSQNPQCKFILNTEAGSFPIPNFQMSSIDTDVCLWLMDSIEAEIDGLRYGLESRHRSVPQGAELVMIDRIAHRSQNARRGGGQVSSHSPMQQGSKVQIYPVGHLLAGGLTSEKLLSGLKSIEEINGQQLGLESAFIDSDTAILFIKGNASIRDLVTSLIDAMEKNLRFLHLDVSQDDDRDSSVPHELTELIRVELEELDMASLRKHIEKLARLRSRSVRTPRISEMIDSEFESAFTQLQAVMDSQR